MIDFDRTDDFDDPTGLGRYPEEKIKPAKPRHQTKIVDCKNCGQAASAATGFCSESCRLAKQKKCEYCLNVIRELGNNKYCSTRCRSRADRLSIKHHDRITKVVKCKGCGYRITINPCQICVALSAQRSKDLNAAQAAKMAT